MWEVKFLLDMFWKQFSRAVFLNLFELAAHLSGKISFGVKKGKIVLFLDTL
jgi:hypothetical protein